MCIGRHYQDFQFSIESTMALKLALRSIDSD
jgi:hypothetical protein